MSGIGDRDLFCSTWGTEEIDGIEYQRWSISWKGERKCFLELPLPRNADEAFLLAAYMKDRWEA